jgi:hypothetical protein
MLRRPVHYVLNKKGGNMKEKILETKSNVLNVWVNVAEFVQATSLVIVAAYSGSAVHDKKVTGVLAYVIAVAAAVIGVRGAYEVLKHFNKKG